jgi:hypothetical protein
VYEPGCWAPKFSRPYFQSGANLIVFETVDIYHFMSISRAAGDCQARLRDSEILGQQLAQGTVSLTVHGARGKVDAILSIRLHLHGVSA